MQFQSDVKLQNVSLSSVSIASAVHAVNTIARPEGIARTILKFRALPRIPLPDTDSLLLTQKVRFEAMWTARKEMKTITAKRRIKASLKDSQDLCLFPALEFGDEVRIWRETFRRFTEPHTVHGYDNEKTVYIMTDRIRPFSTRVVQVIPRKNQALISCDELAAVPLQIDNALETLDESFGPALPALNNLFAAICNAFIYHLLSRPAFSILAKNGFIQTFVTFMVKT